MNSVDPLQNGELSSLDAEEFAGLVDYLNNIAGGVPSASWTVPRRKQTSAGSLKRRAEFRYAPSIITRSEAELLGLSDPRFAIRAMLKEGSGLINLRRTTRFKNNCAMVNFTPKGGKWPGESIKDPPGEWEPKWDQTPIEVLNSTRISCIADSVLRANERLQGRYHLVQRDFAAAYGEKPQLIGTSYVKHIHFQGGGLCAQACCFSVAAMMQQFLPSHPTAAYEPGVHGIAEITAIAASPEQTDLHLTGLTFEKISTYLEKIGLSAPRQTLHGFDFVWAKDVAKRNAVLFQAAVQAYTVSGFPVIVPTIAGLLPWRITDVGDEPQLNHAVVAVGSGQEQTAVSNMLLINDPSHLPFLQAECAQIAYAASPRPLNQPATFVAAVPKDVAVSLWPTRKEGRTLAGLFAIAKFAQTQECIQPEHQLCDARYRARPADWEPGRFQLVHFGVPFHTFGPLNLHVLPRASVSVLIEQAVERRLRGWHWIQMRRTRGGTCYAVWKAQLETKEQIRFDLHENPNKQNSDFIFLDQFNKVRNLLVLETAVT